MTTDLSTYQKVRTSAGFFDAALAYGRLIAKGKDALDLLNRLSTNDLTPIIDNYPLAIQTVLTNEKGRIIDMLTVVRDKIGHVMLVTSANKEQDVIQWLDKYTIMEDAQFIRASEGFAQFLIWGPKASEVLTRFGEVGAVEMMGVLGMEINSIKATILKESNERFWIFTVSENGEALRSSLEVAVLAANGGIIDDELFEILRVEKGIPIAPNELNDKHNPLETTQTASAVSFTKGCYIGQEVIARLDAQGKVQRQLVGLKFGDSLPSTGDRISDESLAGVSPLGDEIGEITSIANSPSFGNIGLGYVRAKHANPGKVVSVKDSEGNKFSATLVKLPFDD